MRLVTLHVRSAFLFGLMHAAFQGKFQNCVARSSGIDSQRKHRSIALSQNVEKAQTADPRGKIDIMRFAPALGAEVRGIDLAGGLDARAYQDVRAALLEFQVLFFKDQTEIPPATQIQIGRMFGELHVHPAAPQMPGYPEVFVIHVRRDSKIANGEFWHSDVSCDEE